MQRSGSQKALLVISIISIIFAALGILTSLMTIVGGAVLNAAPADQVAASLDGTGVTQGEVSMFTSLVGVIMLIGSALELVVGILGVRAANDNQKIMPVWVLCIIELILCIAGVAASFVNGSFGTNAITYIASIAVAAIMFWIANNIKKEAGK